MRGSAPRYVAEEAAGLFSVGDCLEGRYRIDHVTPGGPRRAGGQSCIATHLEAGHRVRITELPLEMVEASQRALLVTHPNLNTVLETLPWYSGQGLIISEYEPGPTLEELLARGMAPSAGFAVQVVLDLAEAVVALHLRGAAHGLIQPAAVVCDPGREAGALLGYAPLPDPPYLYRPPARTQLLASPADDVWALAGLLHLLLVGGLPPAEGYRMRSEIASVGVKDPPLLRILGSSLATQPRQRLTSAQALRDALAGLPMVPGRARAKSSPGRELNKTFPAAPGALRGVGALSPADAVTKTPVVSLEGSGAGDGPLRARRPQAPPVPLPRAAAEPPRAPLVQDPPPPRGRWKLITLGALGLAGLLAAAAWYWLQGHASWPGRAPPRQATSTSQASSPGASRVRIAVSPPDGPSARATHAPAAPGSSRSIDPAPIRLETLQSGEELGSCMMAQLPPGAFANTPSAEWLCLTTDPRRGADLIRTALVRDPPAGDVTDGMRLWSRLNWYRMAGFTVIRARCCKDAAPLVLPRSSHCGDLGSILNELARVVAARSAYHATLDAYTQTVRCYSLAGLARPFHLEFPLGGGEETALRELLAAMGLR